jgi:hypothetical protein
MVIFKCCLLQETILLQEGILLGKIPLLLLL